MIYDCFPFFNELELLELRFSELDGLVDRFVIAEAPVTHAGDPKPMYFWENRHLFERWLHKVTHVAVDDMPVGNNAWDRENHQRNALIRGLTEAQAGDVVILSDADEIPNPRALQGILPLKEPYRFCQMFCYYWMNCVGGQWCGSCALPFEHLDQFPHLHAVRYSSEKWQVIPDGGWHFSYLGGPERIVTKLESFAHQEYNQSHFKDTSYISRVISRGADIFERDGMRFHFCPLDGRFPETIRNYRAKYRHLICDAAFHENWYSDQQLQELSGAIKTVASLTGAIVEIGCWEGRSTVTLANACYPELLVAIDTWAGNTDENPNHVTVNLARERDIYRQFLTNIRILADGNILPIRADSHSCLNVWQGPIKFAHIDASHDYLSVQRNLRAVLSCLVRGGVVCGSNFLTAHADRADLDGGVQKAVCELLPGYRHSGEFWIWRRD